MEPYLEHIQAWCWRYQVNTRSYPGLHFTAKPEACDAIRTCLTQLCRSSRGSYRTVPLQPLRKQDEAKITGGQKYESFSRLRITIHGESDQLRQMSFRVEQNIVHFDFVEQFLDDFERGLIDVQNGRGDYYIAPTIDKKIGLFTGELDQLSECLWFWPCFGHLWVVE